MSINICSKCEKNEAEISELKAQVHALNAQLAKDSSNSSKPPTSDGLKKKPVIPGSQRRSSGKKRGGQFGHKGRTLSCTKIPDRIINYPIDKCVCGMDLSKQLPDRTITSQVFELPPPKIEIHEHRFEVKTCQCCKTKNVAPFPAGITGQPVEYGPQIKAKALYLLHHQLIPLRRVSEILADSYQVNISIATLIQWSAQASDRLADFEQQIRNSLTNSDIVHFDETGMRCSGKLHWLHVASTSSLTFFGFHPQRGSKAMLDFDILPNFKGVAIHDHWTSYFNFTQCLHGLCNSHILRELTFLHEVLKEGWAKKMKKLLQKIHRRVETTKSSDRSELPHSEIKIFVRSYNKILSEARHFYSFQTPNFKRGSRGRIKQSKGKNLLDRFSKFQAEILRFMHDFRVPFTNNQGERDIRMNKVKQKISGCFRSLKGAQVFCRIRSYFSTAQKQGANLKDAMLAVFLNQPLPILIPP